TESAELSVRTNVQPQCRRQAHRPKGPAFLVFRHIHRQVARFVPSSARYDALVCSKREERAMNPKSQLALALVVGAAVGAAAVQGLHAQAKPKAYQVTELEIIDAEAWKTF